MPLWKKLVFGFFVIWLIGISAGFVLSPKDKDPQQATTKEPAKPSASTFVASCQIEWEIKFKQKLKDPSSLDWDRKGAEFGLYKKLPVVMVPYRAKNGFGALDLAQAVCQINAKTGEVVAVIK